VLTTVYIKYGELYKANPALARKKVIELYQKTKNLSYTARLCLTDRSVIRRIIRRYTSEGQKGLEDRSRRPRNSPYRTSLHIEGLIITERKKTGYGRDSPDASGLETKALILNPLQSDMYLRDKYIWQI
jgi:hypothetical protein